MSTLSSGQGVMFDTQSAARIARVVRDAESAAPARAGGKPHQVARFGRFLAEIIAESNTSQGLYSFQADNVQLGVIGADPSGFTTTAFNGSNAQYCAQEINGASGVQPGTRVWMDFGGFNASNNSTYIFTAPGLECTVQISGRNGSTGGMYSGTLKSGTANGATGSAVTGLSGGAACIVINAPEEGSTSASPYIITPCQPVPGKIIGRDYAGGTFSPIVAVSVTSLGSC